MVLGSGLKNWNWQRSFKIVLFKSERAYGIIRAMQNPFRYGANVTGCFLRRLVTDSQVDFVDGVYRLIDPLFANHLRRGVRK